MRIHGLIDMIDNGDEFQLDDFVGFTEKFLEFKKNRDNYQADIVSTSDSRYHLIQFLDDAGNVVSRPYNTELFMGLDDYQKAVMTFKDRAREIYQYENDKAFRTNINKFIYTTQQSIALTLDATNNSNKARKRNGIRFEQLIRSVVAACGITVSHETESIDLLDTNESMKFEHDIILSSDAGIRKAIGQIKTSSKDRIDKVFMDKYMYHKLSGSDICYFLILLNDVQRGRRSDRSYKVNSTFLPGHFKTYTMFINPLDGVYYLDLNKSIKNNDYFKNKIFTFDKFLVTDMWSFLKGEKE